MLQQNRAQLLGYAAEDPETRETPSGARVAKFNLATSRRWKDGDGEVQEATQFHTIIAWTRHADAAARFVEKGALLQVEGRIEYRNFEHEGARRWVAEIVVAGPEGLINALPKGAPPTQPSADEAHDGTVPF